MKIKFCLGIQGRRRHGYSLGAMFAEAMEGYFRFLCASSHKLLWKYISITVRYMSGIIFTHVKEHSFYLYSCTNTAGIEI